MKILPIIISVLILSACGEQTLESEPKLDLLALLQTNSAFKQPALLDLDKPNLHEPNPQQRIDLWTATFWLQDPKGRDYSGQLAMVRLGLTPDQPVIDRRSQWATNELYAARLSLRDTKEHWQAERLSRPVLGLAKAEAGTIQLEQWHLVFPSAESPSVALSADFANNAIELSGQVFTLPQALVLSPGLPASPLGYVQAPLAVVGTVRVAEKEQPVSGQLWLDHVWGNGLPLGRGQLGVVQLRIDLGPSLALQCLQLRRRGGGGRPIGGCTVFTPAKSSPQVLDRRAVQLEPALDMKQWTLRSEQLDLALAVQINEDAHLTDQGYPAKVIGTYQTTAVQGRAWVEFSGFSKK